MVLRVTPIKRGAAALSDQVNPALVMAHARAWLGTPFVRQGARRDAGADCIGLVRGIFAELCGTLVPPPAWRDDWSTGNDEPILMGLSRHVSRIALKDAQPGNLVTYRVGNKRAAHVGILTRSGIIHAWEHAGVTESRSHVRDLTSAWSLPLHADCEPGPAGLTVDDCIAVIFPDPCGPYAEISLLADGTPLARSQHYSSTAAALAMLDPIYSNIETVE